jgi:hypothetical protein
LLEQAWGSTVKDYRASIEKLRNDVAEAALIRDLATEPTKRYKTISTSIFTGWPMKLSKP